MFQLGWLNWESGGEEIRLFSWQTHNAHMPNRSYQDILQPLQTAYTITNIHINYTKTLKNIHGTITVTFLFYKSGQVA